jgi:hypothetical protein
MSAQSVDQSMSELEKTKQTSKRAYFAVSGQRIKLGLALDPPGLVAELQIARPDIRLLGEIPGGKDVQTILRKRFSKDRIWRDWFRLTPEIESVINELIAKRSIYTVECSSQFLGRSPMSTETNYILVSGASGVGKSLYIDPLVKTLGSYGYSVDHIRRVILSPKADWKKREFQYAEKHGDGSRFCFIEAVLPDAAMEIAFLDSLGAIDLFNA